MSGGAIGIAAANRVYMLEHSIYSVISPEGCASILWRSAERRRKRPPRSRSRRRICWSSKSSTASCRSRWAAPIARRMETIDAVADQIAKGLNEMEGVSGEELLRQRRAKFLAMGRGL